jgi:hypothetical protein
MKPALAPEGLLARFVGLAAFEPGDDAGTFVARADAALYAAKRPLAA